jgi:shikimate dehydrogenase
MSTKPVFGLIGYPLSHSFSPAYFNKKFEQEGIEAEYKLFPIDKIELVNEILTEPNISGLNVTIPYKQEVIPYLNNIDSIAKEIGAVNCIAIKQGETTGYNTDAEGFEASLKPLLKAHHKRAIILGTGGASLAVKYVLNKLGIEYISVSRQRSKADLSYEELSEEVLNKYSIIINTTPLGMYPASTKPSIPYSSITKDHLLYDLIYNPEETEFLQAGRMQGATTKNGLEMLELQAEASWQIWNS